MKRMPGPAGATSRIEVEIEKLVYGGDGLARHDGMVIFVPFTAPGDRVEVRPVERRKSYLRAVVTRMLQPGPGRGTPPCPHFASCGGCHWQHLDYPLQVEAKRAILEEALRHRFPESGDLQIAMKPSPQPYGYRSRARLQVRGAGQQAAVGFYRHRSHEVEDVDTCPLLLPSLNQALQSVSEERRRSSTAPDGELEIAASGHSGWVSAIASPGEPPVEMPEETEIEKVVGEFAFAATASVFFQANEFMLGELMETVRRQFVGSGCALDLYSGAGFFSVAMAKHFREVTAVEASPPAHRLAKKNALRAGAGNLQAVCADVGDWIESIGSIAAPAFDMVLLDPPRSGAGQEIMRRLAEWGPETLIYVSCDPQTMIRDLSMLVPRQYRIDFAEGLDLFPQTYHFETVVRLRRMA
jgi:23S rRNA (uracil1939-C5)-methyltransferase